MIFFQLLKFRKMAREAKENPGKFAGGQAGELFSGFFILPIIFAVFFLAGLFVLGFTEWLGGPYGFFKFLFWFLLICFFWLFIIFRKVYLLIKRSTRNMTDNMINKNAQDTIKVESKIVE